MKCSVCGRHYFFKNRCPVCGAIAIEPANPIARFLSRPLEIGPFCINILYLYFFIAVNLSVLSIVINAIVFNVAADARVVWAQYVVGGLAVLFFALRMTLIRPVKSLIYIRRIVYVVLAVAAATQFAMWNANYVAVQYVIPSFIMLLSVLSFVCLICKWTTPISLLYTLLINAIISIAPFVFALVMFDGVGLILPCIAFGVAMLSLVNAAMLRLLSIIFSVREGN